jgi:hypothetical protein
MEGSSAVHCCVYVCFWFPLTRDRIGERLAETVAATETRVDNRGSNRNKSSVSTEGTVYMRSCNAILFVCFVVLTGS